MVGELADIGVAASHDDEVELTELGTTLAALIALSDDQGDEEEDELDLVDTDAQSLLLVCVEEMALPEARAHVLAWCEARPADEAADELSDAILDEDDPEVRDLGFEALTMIDRAEAERAVKELRSDSRLRARATAWLRRPPPGPDQPPGSARRR